jgi:hypothetical protein
MNEVVKKELLSWLVVAGYSIDNHNRKGGVFYIWDKDICQISHWTEDNGIHDVSTIEELYGLIDDFAY